VDAHSDGGTIGLRYRQRGRVALNIDTIALIEDLEASKDQSTRHRPHFRIRTNLVHNGAMRTAIKTVRQSVSLPANVAAQVRSLAKARRLSANRMLLELIGNGMEAEKRKQQEFFDLAERFRSATDPEEVKRLGEQMGRMVFGD
jgi:hypothetical protein